MLRIVPRIDYHGLAAGVGVNGEPVDTGYLRCDDSAGYIGDHDLPLGVGKVQPIGGQLTVRRIHYFSVRIGQLKLNPLKRGLVGTGQLVDDQISRLVVDKLEPHTLSGLDNGGLRHLVQNIARFLARLLYYQRGVGVYVLHKERPIQCGCKFPVGVAYQRTIGLGD